MEAVGAVELRTLDDVRAQIAQVGHTAGAVRTLAARGQEAEDNRVADGHVGDARTHLDNNAGPFVATHIGQSHRDVTGDKVVIGVAQPTGGQLDHHLVGMGWIEIDLPDLPLAPEFPQHSSLSPHGAPFHQQFIHS